MIISSILPICKRDLLLIFPEPRGYRVDWLDSWQDIKLMYAANKLILPFNVFYLNLSNIKLLLHDTNVLPLDRRARDKRGGRFHCQNILDSTSNDIAIQND